MPRDKNKDNREKGVLESAVEGVVDFVKENTGLSGQAARDIEGRDEQIRDATRTTDERERREKRKNKPLGK